MKQNANYLNLRSKIPAALVLLVVLPALLTVDYFGTVANNLNNVSLFDRPAPMVSLSILSGKPLPWLQGGEGNETYVRAMISLDRKVYGPALELVREDQLDSAYRDMLAWQLGIELLSDGNVQQATDVWQNIEHRTLESLDQMLTRGARQAEARDEISTAERQRKALALLFDDDRLRYEALADLYLRNDRLSEGVEAFRKGSELVPEEDSQYLLGRAAEAQNYRREAIQRYRRSIALGTRNSMAYFRLAQLLSIDETQDMSESINLCEQALRISPDIYACYELLARIHRSQGNYQLAREWLERGVENVERDSYQALFYRELGALVRDEHRWNLAESYYLRSLELNGADPAALVGMAQTLTAKGNYELALDYHEQAVEQKGGMDAAPINWLLELSRLYQLLKMNQEAIEVFQLILLRDPDNQIALEAVTGLTP